MGVRRLGFKRTWVQFQAPDTGWTFSHYIDVKIVMFVLKRPKNKIEAERGPFLNKETFMLLNKSN